MVLPILRHPADLAFGGLLIPLLKVTMEIDMLRKYLACALVSLAIGLGTANAATLLFVDLSVENEVTIRATDGVSAVTATVNEAAGYNLENIFDFDTPYLSYATSGTLESVPLSRNGTSEPFFNFDIDPFTAANPVFNIYRSSGEGTTHVAGERAFIGESTLEVTNTTNPDPISLLYDGLLASNTMSGNISFFQNSNIVIGEWEKILPVAPVPLPAGFPLLILGLLAMFRFSRKREKAA